MNARSRGRPAGGGGDKRGLLIAAARRQFAAKGYEVASLRSIATDAGVDVSLVSHYFGDKAGLLVATLELPFDPIDRLESALSGDRASMAQRIVRTFLTSWDPHREVFATLFRVNVAAPSSRSPLIDLVREIPATFLAQRLEGANRQLRALAFASELIGLAAVRYVARIEPVASAPVDDLVLVYAPSMQVLLDP